MAKRYQRILILDQNTVPCRLTAIAHFDRYLPKIYFILTHIQCPDTCLATGSFYKSNLYFSLK